MTRDALLIEKLGWHDFIKFRRKTRRLLCPQFSPSSQGHHPSLQKPQCPCKIFLQALDASQDQSHDHINFLNEEFVDINNTGLYKDYIKTWSRRPRADRTWENFKEHFSIPYLELKETNELTLTEAGYGTGTANLVNEIISRMHSELDHRANIIHDPHVAPDPPATAEANAATNTDKPLLEQILAQNQALLRCLECNSNTSNQNRSNTSRPPRTSTGPRQGNPRTPLAAHYNKYCWSHGRCNHVGSECKSKAPGHKDTATMEDKMGGSNYACSVL
jgi:hypothetical protein